MNVLLFGATGMVGQGALLECLDDPDVASVLAVVRKPTGTTHPKLREVLHSDFTDYSAIEAEMATCEVCLFCLGVSAAGMTEEAYRHITYDYTLAAAKTMARLRPDSVFLYVSGEGTDTAERSRMMWARVKGRTENDLLKLPFKAAYMFRPGYIQPARGVRSGTPLYQAIYTTVGFLFPVFKAVVPGMVTSSDVVGRAMIAAVRAGGPSRVIETREINALGAAA